MSTDTNADPPMSLEVAETELRTLAENVDIDGRWGERYEQAASVVLAELDRLRLALHTARMASLRQARRVADVPPGSVVLHVDGDLMNNDPANLVIVRPDERP